jgi:hypothetical protein
MYLELLDLNLGRDTGQSTDGFSGFPQSFQDNTGIVPRLSHDRFLPDPVNSSSIIQQHAIIRRYTVMTEKESINKI